MCGADDHRAHEVSAEGRGAEFSALEMFADKLLTFCDRTGEVLEIRAEIQDTDESFIPLSGRAVDTTIKLRSGPGGPPLKLEWTAQKGKELLVGSTGRPHFNKSGPVDESECWIAVMQEDMQEVSYINARDNYSKLSVAAGCTAVGSWASHEGCRWSQLHSMWFFMPRKIQRLTGDKAVVFKPLLMAVPAGAGDEPMGDFEADAIILAEPPLHGNGKRGCSDFCFVPGTRDCHVSACW